MSLKLGYAKKNFDEHDKTTWFRFKCIFLNSGSITFFVRTDLFSNFQLDAMPHDAVS